MLKKYMPVFLAMFTANVAFTQIDAGLFRFPDVSADHIVFSYANDLWIVPKTGGNAFKLSSPPGVEMMPRFSPDGTQVAFSANYDGNTDIYTVPVSGGVPLRLTHHGAVDRVVDWHPDGKRILFASGRESEKERFNKLFLISSAGGPPEKLPLPYGEFASYSKDGSSMALVFRSEVFRTWKRYRGGDAADIYLFNFADQSSENISSAINPGEELPMWHGNTIYFLSDNGAESRMNLWAYNLSDKSRKQLTNFSEYDVHFPSLGTEEIVFEAGGKLYLYAIASSSIKEVKVNVISDRAALKPQIETADRYIQHSAIGHDGNRVLLEARGEIFSLPAENGFVKNLTRTQGVAERFPAWSHDGRYLACWSDASGEYELYITDLEKNLPARKVTSYGPGYRYRLYWAPDSKKLAYIDESMRIRVVDAATGATYEVDKALSFNHYALEDFAVSWSPDSRWLAFSRDTENRHFAVFIFDTSSRKLHQVTSGYYHTTSPVFDNEGKYLYVFTNQSFRPAYSSVDNTFIYPNATQVAAISLKRTTSSITAPKNEMVEVKKEESTPATTDTNNRDKKGEKEKKEEPKATVRPVEIDIEGFEKRLVLLPVKPGNFDCLVSTKGKVIYLRYPNTGSDPDLKAAVKYFDIEKREEKTILEDASDVTPTPDGKRLLVVRGSAWAVIKAEENQKFEKPLRTMEMELLVDPVLEWKQLFSDAWRFQRDFFYDKSMHGVNWELVRERYSRMLDGAMTREEVNFILGEMIGELNASHTYQGGGDLEPVNRKNVGYLGVNWQAEGDFYKVARIITAGPWNAEVRSPLDMPGVDIKEGNYLLAVNGMPVNTKQEIYFYFQGLGDKTIELTFNTVPSLKGAKTAIVQALSDEYRLRHLAWIEANRKRVEEETNGEAGYIYVPSTGIDGQNELVRQFTAQIHKKALIIDERFNNGGQIPDRFIEILDRQPLAFWAIRDGVDFKSPPYGHSGPKVMLINGWSGSGGDAFPDYFKKRKLGPLIGARTWGGLIGISGSPALVDGGMVTVPTFRMYNPDGTWFREGYGVDPDIEVQEDLTEFAKGKDAQLERGILEIKENLKQYIYGKPAKPFAEAR